MKAILFLAVLILTAQSSPLNEVFSSFIDNLPMDAQTKNSVLDSGLSCLRSAEELIMNTFGSLQRDIQGKHVIEVLKDIILAEDALEHKVAPTCISTFQMIVSFFERNRQPISDIWVDYNYVLYQSYVIQNFGRALESLARYQFANAGKLLADALKVGNGMMKPELGDVVKYDYTKFAPFDEERFIREFISSLLKELGANQNQINGTVTCVRDLVNVTKSIASNPALHRGDKFTAVHALLEGAIMLTDSLQKCEQVKFYPVQNFAELFIRYPLPFIARLYANGILERLTIDRSQWNFNQHGGRGEYTLAGKDAADYIKAYLRDIANF